MHSILASRDLSPARRSDPDRLASRRTIRTAVVALALLGIAASFAAARAAEPAVVLVTIDGVRWQEVFAGADERMLDEEHGKVGDVEGLRERYWRATPEERRVALMPFLWQKVADAGLLAGDDPQPVRVTNGKNFSYPGYNELLAGVADPRIDSNKKVPNPNVTVLEWVSRQRGFERRVAAAGSWDVFPYILNEERSGLLVNAGWAPLELEPDTPAQAMMNRLMSTTTREWQGVRFDSFTAAVADQILARRKPRLLYIALGEPDDWAHEGRYDRYLDSIAAADRYLARLWSSLQALPDYRGHATLIVTADHGRGSGPADWTDHGSDVAGSDRSWLAVLGAGFDPSKRPSGPLTLSQVAATTAAALGLDYHSGNAAAAPAVGGVSAGGGR